MIDQRTFLYVEDDALSRDGLDVVLRRVMGVSQLWMFEDSADFISRVQGLPCKPDVFLLDIHMQPYTGFEMLSMLRSDQAYTGSTIIALTASVMNEEVEMLRSSGFDGVIGKPIDVATFPDLIERVMGGESIWHITQ